jgi:hypothetical protein
MRVKQRLQLKSLKQGISYKISQGYGIGTQTVHGIKNKRMELVKFVRKCDSGPGPSNLKEYESPHLMRTMLPVFTGLAISRQKEHLSLLLGMHR